MKNFFRMLWLASGVLLIGTGIYCMMNPAVTLVTLVYIVAAAVLFNGIMSVVDFCVDRDKEGSGGVLFDGIVSILFGLVLLFTNASAVVERTILIFFSIWIIIKGVSEMINAFRRKKAGAMFWQVMLVIGMINTVIGIIFLIRPLIAAFAVAVLIGIYLIDSGITSVSLWFSIRRIKKKLLK